MMWNVLMMLDDKLESLLLNSTLLINKTQR